MAGIDYKAANALWRRHRTALTRAENRAKRENTVEAWVALHKLCWTQPAEWDAKGWPWPDDWARWERDGLDAEFAIRRLEPIERDEYGLIIEPGSDPLS